MTNVYMHCTELLAMCYFQYSCHDGRRRTYEYFETKRNFDVDFISRSTPMAPIPPLADTS